MRLVVATKPISKKTEQVLRRRAHELSFPLPLPTLPISAHLEPPPISARLELSRLHTSPPRDTVYVIPGPRSLRSAQQVRHVPSPQGVSQHGQEGLGSSGAEQGGAAGAPGMRVPSLWHDKHRAARTVRLRKVQSYLISYTPLHGAVFLRIGTSATSPMSR